MRASKIRTSFTAILFSLFLTSFAVTGQAQTISPPPTAAGYPYWKTFDAEKITRGNDGAVWFAGNRGQIGRLSLTGALKNFTVEPPEQPERRGITLVDLLGDGQQRVVRNVFRDSGQTESHHWRGHARSDARAPHI